MLLLVLLIFLSSIRTTEEFITQLFGVPRNGIQLESYALILLWRNPTTVNRISAHRVARNFLLAACFLFALC